VGIPEKRSQWGLATFPGSGARLSCHQRSNRESGLPVQYCSGSGELIGLSRHTSDYFQHCAILNSPEGPVRRSFHATMGTGVVHWSPLLSPCGAELGGHLTHLATLIPHRATFSVPNVASGGHGKNPL